MPRNKIFISYSHKDSKLFDEFKTMLAPAIQKGLVDLWDDKKISPGAMWKEQIQNALASASVAVLLVSQNFLASRFIIENELPPLLNAARREGVTIFWIYLSSCLFEQTEIKHYQAAHDISKPLDRLSRSQRQAVLSTICAKLIEAAKPPKSRTTVSDVASPLVGDRVTSLHAATSVTMQISPTALMSEIKAAGYPATIQQEMTIEDALRHTDHSAIYRFMSSGEPTIAKLTSRGVASVLALQKVQEKIIASRDGGVSITVATPEWVGESSNHIVEIQEYHPGITLERMVLQSHDPVQGDLLAHIYNCLIRSVASIHRHGILHRDISPSNVLISAHDNQVQLTLIDLSFACHVGEDKQIPVKNANYTAPEQIAGRAVPASDFYSVAGVCYFLANGEPPNPYHQEAFEQGLSQMKFGSYRTSYDFTVSRKGFELGNPFQIIQALLSPNPEDRPTQALELLLETGSSAARWNDPLIGLLKLDESFVLLRSDDYEVVHNTELTNTLTKELHDGRIKSDSLRLYVEHLVGNAMMQ